jgi:hypothetical protein
MHVGISQQNKSIKKIMDNGDIQRPPRGFQILPTYQWISVFIIDVLDVYSGHTFYSDECPGLMISRDSRPNLESLAEAWWMIVMVRNAKALRGDASRIEARH